MADCCCSGTVDIRALQAQQRRVLMIVLAINVVTFAMMIGLPILQLMLFGFAINADPRHLPTLIEINDSGPLQRAIVAGMANSTYFDFRGAVHGLAEGDRIVSSGAILLLGML